MDRNNSIASLAVNAWINKGRVYWPFADLSGMDLSNLDFSGAYLTHADLYGAHLYSTNFQEATLTGVSLTRAACLRTDFRGAALSGVSISADTFLFAQLEGAKIGAEKLVKFHSAQINPDGEKKVLIEVEGGDYITLR